MKSLLLFGNGIGMALDPDYFRLAAGLEYSWKGFNENEQGILSLYTQDMPLDENSLEKHHETMNACKILSQDTREFLSEDGILFPDLYADHIYRTAKYFYDYNGRLPKEYVENLSEYINQCEICSICTLNYDKLLYDALYENNFLKGYDSRLIDGVFDTGYMTPNLERKFGNTFGWYLHLHGSPLIYEENGAIKKHNIHRVPVNNRDNNLSHEHIVLSHLKHKPTIIASSKILYDYASYLLQSIIESDHVIVIRYGGGDTYLNELIKRSLKMKGSDTEIEIVQYADDGADEEKWKIIFGHEQLSIKRYRNILEYRFMK